jgi:hypothetical protein
MEDDGRCDDGDDGYDDFELVEERKVSLVITEC